MADTQYCDLAQAARILGKNEDDVRKMIREGVLREYRDAGKSQYRVDEVNRLAAKEGSSIIDLAVGDAEPTAEIGGSASDVIALESKDGEKQAGKEDTKITSVGISVFDDDELEIDADPLAKTHIATAAEDQIPIGGAGTGSGLLDLTRESDDTSLGAELLDVISPTEGSETETQAAAAAEETLSEAAGAEPMETEPRLDVGAPVGAVARAPAVASTDPLFTGLMVASVVSLGLVGFVAASAMAGVWPQFLATMADNIWYVLGGGVAMSLIAALVGFLAGRSGSAKSAAMQRMMR